MAQVDFFLKIDGVDGESQDDKHKGEIEVASFSWGMTQSGANGRGSGAGVGKASFQDIHFTAGTSKASPKLFLGCASGQHFNKAVLTVRKAGERPVEYLYIKMNDVLVSSYSLGSNPTDTGFSYLGTQDDAPVDQFSLNFAKIEIDYVPQKPDGSLDDTIAVPWDLNLNKSG